MVSWAAAGRMAATAVIATNTQQSRRNSSAMFPNDIFPPGGPIQTVNLLAKTVGIGTRRSQPCRYGRVYRQTPASGLLRAVALVAGAALLAQRFGVGGNQVSVAGFGVGGEFGRGSTERQGDFLESGAVGPDLGQRLGVAAGLGTLGEDRGDDGRPFGDRLGGGLQRL